MKFSRRLFLGGSGVAIALPFLESLLPRTARAQPPVPPKRLVYYFVPNGMHMPAWRPTTQGADYAITPILKPLEALRRDFSVVSGLVNAPARPDGPGDHASGTGAFITCAHPKKTEGADIQNGVSADQIAANAIGKATRFPSLQLGLEGGSSAGGCDSGYSCAYSRNISWSGPATPLPKLTNPQTVFDRLFEGFDPASTAAEQERRKRLKKSVLDFAVADAQSLSTKLGRTDQHKLDEYLTGVRGLERRIGEGAVTCTPGTRPATNPAVQEHVRIMSDLMIIAMQCDLTRVITFMLGNGGSGRTFPFLNVTGGHHQLSHHQSSQANFDALQKIDIWEMEQLFYFLDKMKSVAEGGSNMLYNSVVFVSSEISDGDRHNHDDMPILVAGHGGGALMPGRHIVFAPASKLSVGNLLVTMNSTVGVTDPVGDSTGALPNL
jgi:Protein of unknown function (DUF1552)